MISRLSKISILSLIILSDGFNINRKNPINYTNRDKILERTTNVIMNYDKFKDCKERLNLIPSFHATIITNNWMNYIQEKNNDIKINQKTEEYSNYIKYYNEDNTDYPLNYLMKSLFDFKVFISINKNLNNLMLLAWIPDNSSFENTIAYLVACKIENNVLEVYRFIQNPYYDRDFLIKSQELKNDIDKLVENIPNVERTNYSNLHNYDKRYYISWTFYDR